MNLAAHRRDPSRTVNAPFDDELLARAERTMLAEQEGKQRDRGRLRKAREPGVEVEHDPKTGLTLASKSDDRGTSERLLHLDETEVVTEGDAVPHLRIRSQRCIDRYRLRQELDPRDRANNERLWHAGNQLSRDFTILIRQSRVVADLNALGGGSGIMSDAQAVRITAARGRYLKACRAVGNQLWPVVRQVCCLDGSATDWAHAHGWARPRDGMVVLRLGLDALATHYRIERQG